MKITDDTTAVEVEEALVHMVAAARASIDPRGYDVMHRRINEHLTAWEWLSAFTH